ncbi:MAG: hypothetical protein M9927_10610 [Anaerolineae bacterium]|nr:hypothetical protein [Anaerolineae bacterium]
MPFRLTQKRRQPEPPPAPPRPALSPLDVVLAYHQTTKHAPYRYARSLGYMDWDTQPNPFRRYAGARLVALDEIAPGAEPSWDTIFQPGTIIPPAAGSPLPFAAFLRFAGVVSLEGIRRQPLGAARQPVQRQSASHRGLPDQRAGGWAAGEARRCATTPQTSTAWKCAER